MALCYYCSGTAGCHVYGGTGVQGDGRVCAICSGSGKCTHCRRGDGAGDTWKAGGRPNDRFLR